VSHTIDDFVSKYLQLRQLKKEKDEAHKKDTAPIVEMMEKLEEYFRKKMDEAGLESLPTKHGTPYKTKRTSVTVADWQVAFEFIQENELWGMLEKRVSKAAVQEYIDEREDLPPGLNLREEIVVNVRSSNG